jgi:hypothetical protein
MPAPGSRRRSEDVDLGEPSTPHGTALATLHAASVTTLRHATPASSADTIHDPHAQATLHDPHVHESPPTIDAHVNAHAHDFAPPPSAAFPHEKLDAYRVALDMARLAKRLAAQVPRGQRSIADHLLRAASNAVLLLAEGANLGHCVPRPAAVEKRQRFVESRGECAEVAAAADLIIVLELGSVAEAQELKSLAARVSSMLTRLFSRLRPS